jgi:hypothetical protein
MILRGAPVWHLMARGRPFACLGPCILRIKTLQLAGKH